MFPKKKYAVLLTVGAVLLPSLAFAQYGLEETAGAAGLAKYGTDIPGMIGNILGTALSLVGVLFFALMLYGGVMWMISRGNTEQEKKALDTITAAIIGILIVLGSYALTSFVFKNLVKSDGSATPVVTALQGESPTVKSCKPTMTDEEMAGWCVDQCPEDGKCTTPEMEEECSDTSFCAVLDGTPKTCIINPEDKDSAKYCGEQTGDVACNAEFNCKWE